MTAVAPATTTDHPLVIQHRDTLEAAMTALATREYYSAYPESPSPRVYGETAADEGRIAHEGHVGEKFELGYPTTGFFTGDEVSPFGPTLSVQYPRLDVEAGFAAAQQALPAWRDAGAWTRAAVCAEILARLNAKSFEITHAVMHTTGQPYVMSFQAGGPHAQDRGLEAVAASLAEQLRVPASVLWEKPAKGDPIRMQKDYRLVPRGLSLVIGCNTFPTWNSYPALFASLACGNPVVVKPHPRAILPLAITVQVCREVLSEHGFSADLVLLAPEADGEGIAKTLAERPEVAIIDYTGGPSFGAWLEQHGASTGKLVYTEKAGLNTIVIDSCSDVRGMTGNLAFSFSLYSGQMCTAPQNVYIPRGGIEGPDGHLSYDEVCQAIAKGVAAFTKDDAKAVELLGALVNEDVKQRAASVDSLASEVGGTVVLAPREVSHPTFPDAVVRTPALISLDAEKQAAFCTEHFGPVAFLIAVDDTKHALRLVRETISEHGAMTCAVYSTSEQVLDATRDACADAGVALSENLMGHIFVNQTAAFSDYHGTGANPAANASYTDAAFVANRFRVVTSRRHV